MPGRVQPVRQIRLGRPRSLIVVGSIDPGEMIFDTVRWSPLPDVLRTAPRLRAGDLTRKRVPSRAVKGSDTTTLFDWCRTFSRGLHG